MSRYGKSDSFDGAASEKLRATTSPVDQAVLEQIGAAESAGRGWVLDMTAVQGFDDQARREWQDRFLDALEPFDQGTADDDQVRHLRQEIDALIEAQRGVSVGVHQTVSPVDEYQRPVDYRAHGIDDVQSFVMFAKRYGDAEKSLVMVSDAEAVVVVDEEVERGDRELIRLPFGQTPEFRAWDDVVGRKMGHKKLLQFLVFHLHTMESPELLASMRKATVNAMIDNTSDIQETEKTLAVMVKSSAGEELAKFPKELTVRVPVLQEDVLEDAEWMTANMRLQIDLPDKPTEAVGFTLICSEWPMLVRKRTQKIVEELRDALGGWTVLRGHHNTSRRELGPEVRPDHED